MASKYVRKPVPIPQEWRGLSRTFTEDTQPLDSIKDIDILTKSYRETLQTAIDSQSETPCSSGSSSPTITVTQSPLSMSRGGWTTGNTTERSSLYSTYSMEDFDKLATNAVSQHFEEINSILFEGQRQNLKQPVDVARECHEWSSQFPHLRVLGKQACPSKDTGFYHVPSSQGSRPTSSSVILDVSDNSSLCSDSQGLCVTGQHVSPVHAPVASLSGSDWHTSPYSFLVEEVIEEDGVYEDIIAVDYKNIYEDNMEYKKQITPRQRRVGYPPITPNACVKDSVMSGVFDHVWQEIMSWIRELLSKYTAEISDSRKNVASFSSPSMNPSTIMSREVSLILPSNRQHSFQRSNTHMGSVGTEKSINELLHITSMPLQNRPHGHHMDPPESNILGGSSTQSGSSLSLSRPPSIHRLSLRASRGGRLAPIAKTSSIDEDKVSNQATEALRVKGWNPISNDLHSPPSNFHRNVSLPPLDIVRTQYRKLHQGHRAASAIDNKDVRLLSYKEKTYFVADLARPNTTNAMRESDTHYSGNQNRRSSTALGNTYSPSSRNSALVNRSLDVQGNSLQLGGDTIHIHPDIQEDLQESTGEDIYYTHWNTTQPTHNMYRRSRVSMR
ncbi:hypothetical protein BsWGS_06347 [Bradybaena similaris]